MSIGNLLEQMITEDMGIGIHLVFYFIVFYSYIISLIQWTHLVTYDKLDQILQYLNVT